MWASKTCYSKLHGADCLRKSQYAVSINGTAFAKHFLNFCHDKQISALVDIGSNDSCLKKIAEDNAFKIAAYEYMPSHSEASHFDLISLDTRQAKTAKAKIVNIWGNQEYVTTCFNVLEHIDIEDIPSAIFNLFDVSNDFLIVSIFTRPGSHGNSPHSTILPISTWKHLFEIVGFEVLDDKFVNEGQDVVTTQNDEPSSLLVTQWTKADIFRNRSAEEPNYLLLR